MRKLILGIAIVLFMIQSAIATTTNFGPTDAVSIQNANGNWQNKLDPLLVVHATGSAIFVGSFTIDSKTFLKFDLTSISADATIDDAQLTLSDSIAAGNGGADVTISLFDNNNWDQSTKNFPTGNSKLLSNKVVTNTGTYTWDVKQGISKNIITLILETASNDAVGFSGLGTSNKPELKISYTEPIPPVTPTTPTVAPTTPHIGKINGTVFKDINNNGEKDKGERGISGIRIRLKGIDENNKNIVMTTKTKKNGRYSFNNLPIGNYKIITNRNVITVDLNEDKVINFGLKH